MTTDQAGQARRRRKTRDWAMADAAKTARIADLGIGTSQSQSISPEAVAELRREVERLQTWHINHRAMIAERDETIKEQSERIADLIEDNKDLLQYNGEKDERVREIANANTDLNLSLDRLEDENANLRLEVAGQASEIEKLQRHLSNQARTIKCQAATIARLSDTTDMPVQPSVRLTEQVLPVSGTDTVASELRQQDSPVSVHTAPAVRWAGGK